MLNTHLNTDKHATELHGLRTIFGKSTNSNKFVISLVDVGVINEVLEQLGDFLTGTVVLAREWKNCKAILVEVEIKWCLPVNYEATKAKAILHSDHG